MRRIAAFALASAICLTSDALACGDKYVILGQGVRFQRAYAAAHPANILLFLKSGSKWSAQENRERLVTVLRLVGHHPDTVATIGELQAALGTNKYDVILTEFGTEADVTAVARDSSVHPTVVPVVLDPTRDQMKQLQVNDACAVQLSKRSHELLTVINVVMEQRSKGVTEACERKRV
jgi:hypothetical protein